MNLKTVKYNKSKLGGTLLKNKFNLLVFIAYAAFSFILIAFHEPWRDEAQAWLIARDLNIFEMFSQMKYEGHFLLWYLIIAPFAKLGFPYVTTNVISWIFCCASVWITLNYSPFKPCKKVLFVFSLPMIYLFPVISRCYSLVPLAVALAAVFYKDRDKKPMRYILSLALIANTHVIMLGMVGILLLEFYTGQIKNRKINTKEHNAKIIKSAVVITVLLILSALPMLGCFSANTVIGYRKPFVLKLKDAVINEPVVMVENIYFELTEYSNYILFALLILIGIFCIIELINHTGDFIKIVPMILWQNIVYTFVVKSSYQKAATTILILFFFLWVRCYKDKKNVKIRIKKAERVRGVILVILAAANILGGAIYIQRDVRGNFSTAYQMGEYINKNVPSGSIIIAGGELPHCTAIIPYTDNVKYYSAQSESFFSFTTWNDALVKEIDSDFADKALKKFGSDVPLYYIYTKASGKFKEDEIVNRLLEQKKLIKLNETYNAYFSGEQYILYKIEP